MSSWKLINRKKLIEELEHARQGFSNVLDLVLPYIVATEMNKYSMTSSIEAHHLNLDILIKELGGESVNRKYKYFNKAREL